MKKINPKQVSDTNLLEVEYYNPNKFDIIVVRDNRFLEYISLNKIPLGPEKTILKSESFLVLPHRYIIFHAPKGVEFFDLTVNMGKLKRKGNKLPSIPVFDPKSDF